MTREHLKTTLLAIEAGEIHWRGEWERNDKPTLLPVQEVEDLGYMIRGKNHHVLTVAGINRLAAMRLADQGEC